MSRNNTSNVITPNARLSAITRHMMSSARTATSSAASTHGPQSELPVDDVPVLFRSELNSRTYVLNRPKRLNALDLEMIKLLGAKIEAWEKSPLCHLIIGTGTGIAFCAGGDVKRIVEHIQAGKRTSAIDFFHHEFKLDYELSKLKTPYVAILDGITMGGGVGLSISAPFRVVTENTAFAMPETLIGYFPDVGASHFLSRLDGHLGTFLALTGQTVTGRDVFNLGIGTHFVSSHRIPTLVERLQQMEQPSLDEINQCIEEFYAAPSDDVDAIASSSHSADAKKPKTPDSILDHREAIDSVFSKDSIEEIITKLEEMKDEPGPDQVWARETHALLMLRSPTSLKVALEAIRRGRSMKLGNVMQMELGIATAYCSGASKDFVTGVTSRLVNKSKERPTWSPDSVAEISRERVTKRFFEENSEFLKQMPREALFKEDVKRDAMTYSLVSEEEIGRIVRGEAEESGQFALTEEELIEYVCERWPKQGTREKVQEVIARRCAKVEATETQTAHLRWIH